MCMTVFSMWRDATITMGEHQAKMQNLLQHFRFSYFHLVVFAIVVDIVIFIVVVIFYSFRLFMMTSGLWRWALTLSLSHTPSLSLCSCVSMWLCSIYDTLHRIISFASSRRARIHSIRSFLFSPTTQSLLLLQSRDVLLLLVIIIYLF